MDFPEYRPAQNFQLIEQLVEEGNIDMLKKFSKLGYVNINALKNPSGLTMLMVAARKGQAHVVSYFLDHQNVDLEIQDMEGKTALFFAAWGGHTEIVDLLLNRGAKLFAISHQGTNPFLLSLQSGNKETVFRLLAAAMQYEKELDFSIYMRANKCIDIMLEFSQQRIACRNRLASIVQPIILRQNGFELSYTEMQALCQQFPLWYTSLIKQELDFVCSTLHGMKMIDQHFGPQTMTPDENLVVFLPTMNHAQVAPAPAPFIPKRKSMNDIDQDRENKKRKKETDTEMGEDANPFNYHL